MPTPSVFTVPSSNLSIRLLSLNKEHNEKSKTHNEAFAQNGQKNAIPENYSSSMESNQATWDQGFGQITMIPVAAGGLPPKGQDFNGIFNQISENVVHLSKGGRFKFSADYAAAINGYPKGAILQSDDEKKEYQSIIDNNKVNFNTATQSQINTAWKLVSTDDMLQQIAGKQPAGNYALKGDSYTKVESDTKFQPKGNYATNTDIQNITSETIFSRAEAIPLNVDLNDYLNPGLYFQSNGSPGENSKNYPRNTGGSLEVIKTGNSSVKQVYTAWYDNKTWVRRYNGGSKTWADKWDEDFTALNPPTASDVGAYSTQQADAKFQLKGDYLDKGSTQEQVTKGFLTASRRLSVEAPDKARAILYAVESGNVGISAQDSTGKWLGDIKHPANGKNGTLAIVEQLIGEGQKWVDVTSQRRSKVTYTNETSRPILVCVTAYGEANNVNFLVNDVVVALIGYNSQATIARPLSVIIPAGAKYRISDTIGYTYTWSELR